MLFDLLRVAIRVFTSWDTMPSTVVAAITSQKVQSRNDWWRLAAVSGDCVLSIIPATFTAMDKRIATPKTAGVTHERRLQKAVVTFRFAASFRNVLSPVIETMRGRPSTEGRLGKQY